MKKKIKKMFVSLMSGIIAVSLCISPISATEIIQSDSIIDSEDSAISNNSIDLTEDVLPAMDLAGDLYETDESDDDVILESLDDLVGATFNDINAGSVFLKQAKGSTTCTLVASAMLVRRAAMMNGNGNWSSVTEASMKSTAWVNGAGLKNSFSYAGINVTSAKISSNKTNTFINLLQRHPEGIVIYDFSYPHAILLTDYTNGTFYCADPAPGYPSGRIPVSKASITVESADKYWYVSSPSVSFTATEKPWVGTVNLSMNKGIASYSCDVGTGAGATEAIVTIVGEGINTSSFVPISNGRVSGQTYMGSGGVATVTVSVTDSANQTASNSGKIDLGNVDVNLNVSEITLHPGDTYQLAAYVNTSWDLRTQRWRASTDSNGFTGIQVEDKGNIGIVTAIVPGDYTAVFDYNAVLYGEDGWQQATQIGLRFVTIHVILETPSNLRTKADHPKQVDLDWESVAGASGYEISYAESEDDLYSILEETTANSYKHHWGADGGIYYYKVRAFYIKQDGSYVYGDYTNPVQGVFYSFNPSIDESDCDTIKLGEVTLNWTGAENATGFFVRRKEGDLNSDFDWKQLIVTSDHEYTDTTAIPGQQYTYKILPYWKEFGTYTEGEIVVVGDEAIVELKARDRNRCVVTYQTNGGNSLSPIVVDEGFAIKIAPTVTRSGYKLEGWYTDSKCTNKWNIQSDAVMNDMTLYAKWVSVIGTSGAGSVSNLPVSNTTGVFTDAAKTKVKTSDGLYYFHDNGDGSSELWYEHPMGNLTAVTIPDWVTIEGKRYPVTWVYDGAFAGNNNIKSVKIGNNVKNICVKAFYKCINLEKVVIGKEVTMIYSSAFEGCTKLKSVTGMKKVMSISKNAFKDCKKLSKITLPKTLWFIENKAFYNCKSLKAIVIPKEVEGIGKNAFGNCSKLKKVTIKSTELTDVGKGAFKGLAKGSVIKIPNSKREEYTKLLSGKYNKSKIQ